MSRALSIKYKPVCLFSKKKQILTKKYEIVKIMKTGSTNLWQEASKGWFQQPALTAPDR